MAFKIERLKQNIKIRLCVNPKKQAFSCMLRFIHWTVVVHMLTLKTLKRTEFIILYVIWISLLSTLIISLINDYQLLTSDYLGMIGLLIVTIISVVRPAKALTSLLILLFISVFNIFSFLFYFNVVIKFNLSMMMTPGIQLFSLILLITLALRKKNRILHMYNTSFGQTDEDKH